ncbi:MAG: ACP S-malonyltransferase, partial [Buchnera aphidicola]|nr:ACP S-malonyltransferase [Buchnera aphidicola]
QMYKPVRWKEIIEYIIKKKIVLLLEIGPNKVLTKLNQKRTSIISLYTDNLTNFLIALKKIN